MMPPPYTPIAARPCGNAGEVDCSPPVTSPAPVTRLPGVLAEMEAEQTTTARHITSMNAWMDAIEEGNE